MANVKRTDYLQRDTLSRIMVIIAIFLGLIAIYQIMRYLLGGSWGADGLILVIVGINAGMAFKQRKEIAVLQVEMQHLRNDFDTFKTQIEKRFDRVEARLSKVERGMEKIDHRLERMEQFLSRSSSKHA